ncbi:MAG: bifunctional adenosylcobinamide kinase/adenosylcobinamide-phosphate guanylyltransferase [Rhodospirillales bacterium]|nr:bifunctional adenosylcobinamide kinase/adenosylcobinamide-phosphate guanylyltransferase [Rhodospirillales bacterium]MDP6883025.1 bifunctional adenosylcobinamide kinase/adenosylcobinamide-phosphate guanylyltransferase [Rhodospirillales bacterium]
MPSKTASPSSPVLPPLTLVLGGARSGKSRYAESLVESQDGACLYLATAEAGDDEMAARIGAHRERRGRRWRTVETPLDLIADLTAAVGPDRCVLVDCLTLWLSNLMAAGRDVEAECRALNRALPKLAGPAVLVANEVGLGIVSENALARRFRDFAGQLNQAVAEAAQSVVFIAAGLPMHLKSPTVVEN